jgi:hypothetical protein
MKGRPVAGCQAGHRCIRTQAIDALRLALGHRDSTLGVLASGREVRKHVHHDEVGDRRRGLLAERAEAAGRQRALGDVAIGRALRIGGPDRVLVVVEQEVRQVALRGLDPRVEVLGLQHERAQCLAGLRRLGELEGQDRERQMQLGRLAGRSDRHIGVVHVIGDRLVLLRRGHVDRDAVRGEVQVAGDEDLVVGGVIPRRRAGDEGLVQRLDVFERLHGLRRIENHLVVLVDEIAAVRP